MDLPTARERIQVGSEIEEDQAEEPWSQYDDLYTYIEVALKLLSNLYDEQQYYLTVYKDM